MKPPHRSTPDELHALRELVADEMDRAGHPMFADEEGSVYVKLDALFDAVIVATVRTLIDGRDKEGAA